MPTLFAYTAYMSKKQQSQYTIRAIPSELDRLLRKKARDEQLSLNRATISALEESLLAEKAPKYGDLDFCIDTWASEADVDEALKEQRKIDKDLWR